MRARAHLFVICLYAFGCGDSSTEYSTSLRKAAQPEPHASTPSQSAAPRGLADVAGSSDYSHSTQTRLIIHSAHVSLVVEDFAKSEIEIAVVVRKFDGYVAESNVDRTQGAKRVGKWVVRVPANQFDALLGALAEIGVPESRITAAQEVTEEFVDLEARLGSKREVERRVTKLLDNRAGDIREVIAVEGELGRVREEIERMEGRLRYLGNRAALATVTIMVREQQNYVPPQAPTFVAQVQHTWHESVQRLGRFSGRMALIAVGLLPWIPWLVIPAAGLMLLARRFRIRLSTGSLSSR